MTYSAEERTAITDLARQSIAYGLKSHRPLQVDTKELPSCFNQPAAAFITLQKDHKLRGCIGSLEAHQTLGQEIADNAYSAAFRDSRFMPLSPEELDKLEIHVSILSSPQPMTFSSEANLLRQLVPGEDGLIIEDRGRRGTFLPSVWESLPDPGDFLRHLKQKAGLPANYWSDTLQVSRYHTESW